MDTKISISNVFIAFRRSLIRAVSKIAPPKDVEDIVQETYVRVCQVENFQDIKYPRAFLLKTAKNLALDYIKSGDVRLSESMDEEELERIDIFGEETDTTYNRVAAQEEFSLFCEAVRCLPEQCRRAFVLKKVYGYSQKEIAGFMAISESTVEKHIAYGIKRCMDYLSLTDKRSMPAKSNRPAKSKSGFES
ncbi:MAG: sigma-70 family RNA polymerase sigma factor [Porticoccaceae bacterium]